MNGKSIFLISMVAFASLTGCNHIENDSETSITLECPSYVDSSSTSETFISTSEAKQDVITGENFIYINVKYDRTIGKKRNNETYDYTIAPKKPSHKLRDDFAYGADISMINEVLKHGGVFYNEYGQEQDVFEILKENGVNFVRLRLFNDPKTSDGHYYGAGNNDKETDLSIMKKAKRVGMNILLDFHYSDFWADPGHQTIPKAWQNSKNIYQDIKDFTYSTLMYFKNNGINIDAIQLGN